MCVCLCERHFVPDITQKKDKAWSQGEVRLFHFLLTSLKMRPNQKLSAIFFNIAKFPVLHTSVKQWLLFFQTSIFFEKRSLPRNKELLCNMKNHCVVSLIDCNLLRVLKRTFTHTFSYI